MKYPRCFHFSRAMSKTHPIFGQPVGPRWLHHLRGTFLKLEAFAAEILEAYDFGGILEILGPKIYDIPSGNLT